MAAFLKQIAPWGFQTLQSVMTVNAWQGARAAERGENNMLGQINRIMIVQTACLIFKSSPFVTNTFLRSCFQTVSYLCIYQLVLEIGHAVNLIQFDAYKTVQDKVEKIFSRLSTVALVTLAIHAAALVIFKKELAALAFLSILGLGALQILGKMPKLLKTPFHKLLDSLKTIAPLANPINPLWFFHLFELGSQIYNWIILRKKTLKEGTLPSLLNQRMIDQVLDFNFHHFKVSRKHFWINPTPNEKLGKDQLLPLMDRLFNTPERLERLQKKAEQHKDWNEWHAANPFKSKKDFARHLLERLVINIGNEDLPDGQGFDYTDLKYQFGVLNKQMPLRPIDVAETELLQLIFDAGDYCANGVFHQVADIYNRLVMNRVGELPRKILIHLEELRHQVALAFFHEREKQVVALKNVHRMFGEEGDAHRANVQIRRDLAYFGIPERGVFQDKTVADIGIITLVYSKMFTDIVMKTPHLYDDTAITDWLDFHHHTFVDDLRFWAANHPQILETYNRREGQNLLPEEVGENIDYINWLEQNVGLRNMIALYLLEIGVFTH